MSSLLSFYMLGGLNVSNINADELSQFSLSLQGEIFSLWVVKMSKFAWKKLRVGKSSQILRKLQITPVHNK